MPVLPRHTARLLGLPLLAGLAPAATALSSLTLFTDVTSDSDAPWEPGESFAAASNGELNSGDIDFSVVALPDGSPASPSPTASIQSIPGSGRYSGYENAGVELFLDRVAVNIAFNDVPGIFSFDYGYEGGRTQLALNGTLETSSGGLSTLLGVMPVPGQRTTLAPSATFPSDW